MTGRGIDQALSHSSDPELHESYVKNALYYLDLAKRHAEIPEPMPYNYIWGDALEILTQTDPDARIINLETAVTTSSDYWQEKSIHYRMHPQNVRLLTLAAIDVCVLANNHVLDWGHKGLRQTLQTLHQQGIKTPGAGINAESASAPAMVNTPKGRLLVFGYATMDSGIPKNWMAKSNRAGINLLEKLSPKTANRVIEHIESLRKENDRVVLSIHWGGNWGYEIPKSQRRFAHTLIDSGAVDLIHGHSSHHPKGIEVYNGHLIFYGCGDLINDYEGISGYEQYRDDLSLLYFPQLKSSGSLASLAMVPMQIKQFRLNRATDDDREWLLDRLNRECKKLDTCLELSADGAFNLCW